MYRLRESRTALVLVLLIAAVAVVAFLVLKGGDDNSSNADPTNGPEAISVQGLQDLAGSVDHSVYWAGQRANTKYELTITDTGNIFIRYLAPNTPIGSQQVASLTVGTYPTANAYANLTKASTKPGAKTDQTPDGGLVVTNSNKPTSVYIAYRNANYQIEIFDPDPKEALSLATSGAIVPIPG